VAQTQAGGGVITKHVLQHLCVASCWWPWVHAGAGHTVEFNQMVIVSATLLGVTLSGNLRGAVRRVLSGALL
jgi:hypothetical protein